jgi:DNA-binding GntR family transcriptional regulator
VQTTDALTISRGPLHKEVAVAIRNAILMGELKAGARLIEAELAERLGISRAPVREALKQLVAEGLLVNVPRRGTTVIELTEKDIREIFSLRTALEAMAVELITPTISADQIAQLDRLVKEMSAVAVTQDEAKIVDLEMRFHELLCKLSGHSRLHAAWLQMGVQLRAFFAAADPQYDNREYTERHETLLAAIASGDAAHAVATLREHVADGADRVLAAMGRRRPGA